MHVALQDEGQLFHPGGLDLLRQAFQRQPRCFGQLRFAGFGPAVAGDLPRFVAVRHHTQLIACLRQSFQSDDFDRT